MAAKRLYSNSVELADLGTHAGVRLRGRVRRRALRLSLGSGAGFEGTGGARSLSLTLVRLRPFAVEVTDERGTRLVPIDVPPAPAEQMARRLAMVALGCALLIGIAGRLRRVRRGGEDAQR